MFRRQRFGSFSSCCVAWLGHESCCCSGVSQALFFYLLCNVSALFLPAVSHGLGTNLQHASRCCSGVSETFPMARGIHNSKSWPAKSETMQTEFAINPSMHEVQYVARFFTWLQAHISPKGGCTSKAEVWMGRLFSVIFFAGNRRYGSRTQPSWKAALCAGWLAATQETQSWNCTQERPASPP